MDILGYQVSIWLILAIGILIWFVVVMPLLGSIIDTVGGKLNQRSNNPTSNVSSPLEGEDQSPKTCPHCGSNKYEWGRYMISYMSPFHSGAEYEYRDGYSCLDCDWTDSGMEAIRRF